jgi:hypothetical protein
MQKSLSARLSARYGIFPAFVEGAKKRRGLASAASILPDT